MNWEYLVGDVREVLAGLPEGSVQTICTSPPYWGLRDYGIPPSIWGGLEDCEHEWGETTTPGKKRGNPTTSAKNEDYDEAFRNSNRYLDHVADEKESSGAYCHCGAWRGCLGLEPTPEMFIEHMVEVCRGLWRVLRDDGTFFLNLGDSYVASQGLNTDGSYRLPKIPTKNESYANKKLDKSHSYGRGNIHQVGKRLTRDNTAGLKPKDLVMMPHRVALALQADGWYVRSTIVWSKPNPMPESCTDRPTSAHEYIFLLTKKARYFYDADAVRERHDEPTRYTTGGMRTPKYLNNQSFVNSMEKEGWSGQYKEEGGHMGRNLRNVWQIATQPFPAAHFATFPERIPETCIKAGTSERGCCPQCGAPWERVVEKGASMWAATDVTEGHRPRENAGFNYSSTVDGKVVSGPLYAKWKEDHPDIQKGFQPTCECVEEWKRSCGADKNGEYHGKAIKDYSGTGAENPSEVKARILAGMVPKVTTGFQPTCDCPQELEPIPCTVLDPFAGSGTTIQVGRRLGRSVIGIDISVDYCVKHDIKVPQINRPDCTEGPCEDCEHFRESYRKLAVERCMLDTKDILSYWGETA